MSFGLSIKTTAGELLLDERFTVPACVSAPVPTFYSTHSLPGSGYVADEYVYPSPGSASTRLDFWTLPTQPTDVWFIANIAARAAGTPKTAPEGMDSVLLIRPPSVPRTSIAVPRGYCFRTEQLSRSNENWGLAVWKADGSLAFDLGSQHLQLAGVASNVPYPPAGDGEGTTYSNSFSGFPATPAFFAAPIGSEVWIRDGQLLRSTVTYLNSGIRRDGTTLRTKSIRTDTGQEDIPMTASYFVGRAPTDLPFIDASLYG